MIEIDGIVYAESPLEELVRVRYVKPLEEYKLLITFTNGAQRVYDVLDLLDKGVFKQLRDVALFNRVYVDHGTVAWSDDLDIDPDELYSNSVSVFEKAID